MAIPPGFCKYSNNIFYEYGLCMNIKLYIRHGRLENIINMEITKVRRKLGNIDCKVILPGI